MKYWPVPESHSNSIPGPGHPGCFREDRGDRYHCGVDIYAAEMCDVISVEDGLVMDTGIFTASYMVPYWNTTYFVLVKNDSGFLCRYAEMGDVAVRTGEPVNAGQLIGHVGPVLNPDKITQSSPLYIQKIKEKGNHSMLHFELCKAVPSKSEKYLGGNWFGKTVPGYLLDPTEYLSSTSGER